MPLRTANFDSASHLVDFVNGAQQVTVATVVVGGADYAVDDILVVVGGEGVAAVLKVTAAPGGIISTVSIEIEGAYTSTPSNPVSVAGGSGSGATFNLTLSAAMAQGDVQSIEHRNGTWFLTYWPI